MFQEVSSASVDNLLHRRVLNCNNCVDYYSSMTIAVIIINITIIINIAVP